MSTASGVLSKGPGPRSGYGESRRGLPGIAQRRADYLATVPMADWITLGLLGIMLLSVGWSVQLADWGDLPTLLPTLMLGWAAAFIAHRSPLPLSVKLLIAATLGSAIIMWQGSIPAEGSNVADRARDAWDRFWQWIAVARDGGVSSDTVPFALMFMFASWVTAYIVTALTFRLRNPWAPVVLLTVGLLNNLSFRPGLHEQTFFIFILAAVALFAHLTTVKRIDRWRAEGVDYPKSLNWMSMRDGLLFGGIVVAIAAILPLVEVRSERLDSAWDYVKSPITALEDPASRLLSGVDGAGERGYLDVRGSVLAFEGEISLTEEPLMWVTSRYPRMLPGKVYDEYSAAGWLSNSDAMRSVEPRTALYEPPADMERLRTEMLIQPLLDTFVVLPVGGAYAVDQEVEVEYLLPASYSAPLSGGAGALADLPSDVRDFVFQLRFALRDVAALEDGGPAPSLQTQPLVPAEQVSQLVEDLAPEDIGVEIVRQRGTDLAESLNITRVGPVEQVGAALTERLDAEGLYTVTSYPSVADDEALAASTSEYPGWVIDRYLQLPDSLPRQVTELANEIVMSAGARTPHEKVEAIQAFLQSQEYSLEIAGPSHNTDGVYYFLFETQNEPCPTVDPDCDVTKIKGYSQYYGSAGAVLLRAAGVPSRMVAGWGAGEYEPSVGKFLIRDEDRHGWTQAYYAGYGWIDVEMTPSEDEIDRTETVSTTPVNAGSPNIGVGSDEDDPQFLEDLEALDELEAELLRRQLLNQGNQQVGGDAGASFNWLWVIVPGLVVLVLVSLFALWALSHRGMAPAEKAYTKMVRAGRLLGIGRRRWQTPVEYAVEIGSVIPHVADSAMVIAVEYERRRYARSEADSEASLGREWRRVSRALIAYRLKSLFGSRPEVREPRGV